MPWFDRGAASLEVGEGKGATGAALHPAHPAAGSSSFVQDAPDSPYGGCIIFLPAISCTEKREPRATAPTSPGVVLAGAEATDVLAVLSQMAEHHVLEAAEPGIHFLWACTTSSF